jgi:iron complex outermembrane recepter protein
MRSLLVWSACSLALLGTAPANAAGSDSAANTDGGNDLQRTRDSDEIVVSAPLARDRDDIPSQVTVIKGAELLRSARAQIGDSIIRVPGVSAATFGPNTSRPVLRGLTGERVRVLTDGIGAFDVSNTSADHAVAIDPLTAERIEVVRGPGALRFGPSAIGGLVNVLDGRIPNSVPENAIAADVIAGVASAAGERNLGAAITARLAEHFALRVGGNLIEADDLRTGGFILSRPLREQARASADPEVRERAGLRGRLANSDLSTRVANGGIAYVNGADNLGLAVTHMESVYAIPVRFNVDDFDPEEVFLDARQTRFDLRGSVGLGSGPFERLSLRAGYADYAHVEGGDDPDDDVTRFANKGGEARLELVQRQRGVWGGVIGGQFVTRDFEAVGDEAFVPPNSTDEWGIFAVQEANLGPVRLEAGLRYDYRRIVSQVTSFDRSFSNVSASVGAVWRVADAWRLVANLAQTARPPAAEELLANGPHVGTQAFEIGDPTLATERGRGVEFGVRGRGAGWRLNLSGYTTRFSNFIYQVETGEIEDGLPVFLFTSSPARLWGLEMDGAVEWGTLGGLAISSSLVADLVRANLQEQGNAPRIPPARILADLAASSDRFTARAEVERVFAQRRVFDLETPTDGFTFVNLTLDWQPSPARYPGLNIALQANNLFDVEARRHASLLKDFAPMAGRDLRLALRWRL